MDLGWGRHGTDLEVFIVSRPFHHVRVEELTLLRDRLDLACYRSSLERPDILLYM